MVIPIPVKKDNYYKGALTILNFSLGLTELEIDIVATLLHNRIYVIDSDARDTIRKVLNKDKFNTNNYIAKLKSKKILGSKPNDKNLYLDPGIIEATKDNKIIFDFIIYE